MPILEELHNEYRDRGLVVLGLNQRENASQAQAYAEEVGASYPIVLDHDAEIANYFRVMGPPVTIVLDRDDEVIKQFVGMVSRDQLDEVLDPLFK